MLGLTGLRRLLSTVDTVLATTLHLSLAPVAERVVLKWRTAARLRQLPAGAESFLALVKTGLVGG